MHRLCERDVLLLQSCLLAFGSFLVPSCSLLLLFCVRAASFVTILSYAGAVSIGVLIDSRVVSDPQILLDLFVAEYADLKGQVETLQTQGKLQQTLELQDKDKAIH